MRGIVLAAGGGTRLRPLTDALPKTLLTVDGDRSILELALANLRTAGVRDVAVVAGHAAAAITAWIPAFERALGVRVQPIFNDHYHDWNNAYSLWLARDVFAEGALVVNGDTVHPPSVEQALLDARGRASVLLAVDDRKALGEEAMKVVLDADGRLVRITKALDPAAAAGEYIGVTLIEPQAAPRLGEALQATFRRDTSLYYEDGYQQYVDWGGAVAAVPIGEVDWVEVDDHDDLARARTLAYPWKE